MAELTDVVLGGSKKFECRVLGYPRPEIRWYKDGIEITHVKRYNFSHDQDGVISMVMEDINHKDQGMYRCRADNSEGTASTSAYLFVRQRRGHPDEDTMSVHSMSMSEVDSEYQERQLEFDNYAKRIQSDFGEEFLDEFGRKQKLEEILIEEKKLYQKQEDNQIEKGMRETSEKSISNGYLEESYSSKQESTYYEESYEKSSSKSVKTKITEESKSSSKTSKGYSESSEETKISTSVSVDGVETSQSEQDLKLSVETSVDETSVSKKGMSSQNEISTESEISLSRIEESGGSEQAKLKAESSVGKSSKSKQEDEQSHLLLESDASVDNSSSSRTTVEEREVKLVSSEASTEEFTRSRESTLEIDESLVFESKEGDGFLLVDSSVEIESSKYKKKKRMSVEMEVEEKSTVELDFESKLLKSKMLEEIKLMTAEMQMMSKDNVPTDMGSVSSINSLFSEESAEEITTQMNPSEVLEAKIRSKMQARVLETESNADSESVDNITFLEGEMDELRTEDQLRASVRAEQETLAQESNLPRDDLLDLPSGQTEQLSSSIGHDSGIFDMTATESSSLALSKKDQRDVAFAEEQLGRDDESVVSDISDKDSVKAGEETEKRSVRAKSKVQQALSKADEIKDEAGDGSVVSDLADLDTTSVEEFSVDGPSKLDEASVKGGETWHTDQLSDTESMRDETADLKEVDGVQSVEADLTDQGKASAKTTDAVDSIEAPSGSRDVTPTPESMTADDDLSLQSPINEETVSEISEGSIREGDFGVEELLPGGGQFVTSPSDLTSLVRDSQKQSRVTAQHSGDADDIIDDALKDLELDSAQETTKITEEPSPDQAEVRDQEQILQAPEEKKKFKPEEQELTFIPDDVPPKKTKSKKSKTSKNDEQEEELKLTASVETLETSAESKEPNMSIQADVDVSGTSYDEGGLTISASVEVDETRFPPEIVRVPEDVNIQAGESVHLSSEVRGNPQPEVKWFKEGEKVTESQRITLVTEDNVYSLEIREAEGSDGGKYTLTAHNSEGTIFSDVHVNVTVPPGQKDKIIMEGDNISVTATLSLPEFTQTPEDVTVSEFDPVSFVCKVTGNPEPKVTWKKEGKKLKADQRLRIYESDGQHFLEIPQSSLLDAGEYECQATNSEGSTSCHVVLTVEAATEQESGLSATEETAQPREASESDVRTRYLKLFGAAAAFTLVAFGFHKLTEGRLPTSR